MGEKRRNIMNSRRAAASAAESRRLLQAAEFGADEAARLLDAAGESGHASGSDSNHNTTREEGKDGEGVAGAIRSLARAVGSLARANQLQGEQRVQMAAAAGAAAAEASSYRRWSDPFDATEAFPGNDSASDSVGPEEGAVVSALA